MELQPAYYIYHARTYKVVSTPDGDQQGYVLNLHTGAFDPDNRLINEVMFATTGEISRVGEDEFIDETEITRADYLNGDGPIFALYQTIDSIYNQAKNEGRERVNPQELALIKALRRRTFTMWEQEFARQAAGEPPANTYTSKATK
jgi:hypothetical protein